MQVESFLVNYYKSIPIVSRVLFSISIILTALTYLDVITPYNLVYSFAHIKQFELWRAVTAFFYLGPATLDTLVHHFFMLKYCIMMEESGSSPADFLYMIIVGMAMILVSASFLGMSKLSSALSTYIIYIWSKKNPLIIVQYMGLFSIPAYYIPWIMFIFSSLAERALPVNDLVGIMAGHVYFYFKTVYTRTNPRSDPLRTPQVLKSLFIAGKPAEKREQQRAEPAGEHRRAGRAATLDDIRE
ncbi:Derlin-2/3 [Nematocida minor]|uniref:Derlin-2/3 n=1 Tax=Nematocida minor TaxID=1912983 RepID=UPI00221E6F5B|nr:Derlin-2/3 [Nematocida minor]KAI5191907.1 Derlin-2/3 [Nematocida minor]